MNEWQMYRLIEWPLYRPQQGIPANATLDEWLNGLIALLAVPTWQSLAFIVAFVS